MAYISSTTKERIYVSAVQVVSTDRSISIFVPTIDTRDTKSQKPSFETVRSKV